MTDAAALERLAAGEPEALAAILDRYEGRVYAFALALTRSPDDAADVTQDAFLVLLRRPDAFDPARGALGAFLLGVARNLVLKRWRSRRAERPLEEAGAVASQEDERAGRGLEAEEQAQALRDAVGRLSPVQRQVVTLRFQQEQSLEQVSGTLLLPLNTVKSHLRRAVERLRRELGHGG
ncbi:MAG: sigma-70 family RNA polymerase sigma factor [Elusimicrobia bacterium]|nr:sigma-70 family RNA polymerase sigma factor [Elusimicrobiota bacterium]